MSGLASFAHHAVIGGLVIAAFVVAGCGLLCFVGRTRQPSRLERELADAALEDAMARAQAKSISDEGGDREPA